jgi:hypothetical protein
MIISWYGLGCLKIESKTNQGEITIITEPFDSKKTGLRLPRGFKGDIVLISKKEEICKTAISPKEGSSLFWIDKAGEYEKSGVFIWGMRLNNNSCLSYIIEAEDLHLFYSGPLSHLPEEKELGGIEAVDILFLPVGGHEVLTAKDAVKLVAGLEPRLVIPMYYKLPDLKMTFDGSETFLRAIGFKGPEPIEKFKITKKDLPIDETKIILLNPPY